MIVALLRWGDRWKAGEEGPPLELVHRDCGHTMMPELTCPECGEPVGARDVEVKLGPVILAELGMVSPDTTSE